MFKRLRRPFIGLVAMLAALLGLWVIDTRPDGQSTEESLPEPTPTAVPTPEPTVEPEPTPIPTPSRPLVEVPVVDLATVGEPQSSSVQGLLTFRGNPTRTFDGTGPAPTNPAIRWAFPANPGLCEVEPVNPDSPRCGVGWTGQPAVFVRDSRTWVVFGALDGNVYFVDAATGGEILPAFGFDGPIETTPTIDPDGLALAYVGGTDGTFRIVAFDRPDAPEELWRMHGSDFDDVRSSDDWDSAALVSDDLMVVAGENSRLVVVKLNKGTDGDGLATVDPEIVWSTPTWDDQLDADLGFDPAAEPSALDPGFSVESSVSMSGTTVWFSNSAGLVQGWDLLPLETGGEPTQVFRYWLGDDADSSVVVSPSGDLFAGQLLIREGGPAGELGQVVRLDPTAADPVVWSFVDGTEQFKGVRSTVALHEDVVYVTTNGGRLLGLDAATGEIRWEKQLTGPTWGSPVVVDQTLIVGDCSGVVRGYDVTDTTADPPVVFETFVGGCLEATPAVFEGVIYIGDRNGRVFAIADN